VSIAKPANVDGSKGILESDAYSTLGLSGGSSSLGVYADKLAAVLELTATPVAQGVSAASVGVTIDEYAAAVNLALATYTIGDVEIDDGTVTWEPPVFDTPRQGLVRIPTRYRIETRETADGAWTSRPAQTSTSYAAPDGTRQVRITPTTSAGDLAAKVADLETESTADSNEFAYMLAATEPSLPTSTAEAIPAGWIKWEPGSTRPSATGTMAVYRIGRKRTDTVSWADNRSHPLSTWVYRRAASRPAEPTGNAPAGWTLGAIPSGTAALWGSRILSVGPGGAVWTTPERLTRTTTFDSATAWAFDPETQPWIAKTVRLGATIANKITSLADDQTHDFNSTVSGTSTGATTIRWSVDPQTGVDVGSITSSGVYTPPDVDADLEVTVRLTVTRGGLTAVDTDTFTVTNAPVVRPVASAPTVSIDGDATVREGNTGDYDATVTGGTYDEIAYAWSVSLAVGTILGQRASAIYTAPDDVSSDTDIEVRLSVTVSGTGGKARAGTSATATLATFAVTVENYVPALNSPATVVLAKDGTVTWTAPTVATGITGWTVEVWRLDRLLLRRTGRIANANTGRNVLTYDAGPLAADTRYDARVKATGADDAESGWTDSARILTDPLPVARPPQTVTIKAVATGLEGTTVKLGATVTKGTGLYDGDPTYKWAVGSGELDDDTLAEPTWTRPDVDDDTDVDIDLTVEVSGDGTTARSGTTAEKDADTQTATVEDSPTPTLDCKIVDTPSGDELDEGESHTFDVEVTGTATGAITTTWRVKAGVGGITNAGVWTGIAIFRDWEVTVEATVTREGQTAKCEYTFDYLNTIFLAAPSRPTVTLTFVRRGSVVTVTASWSALRAHRYYWRWINRSSSRPQWMPNATGTSATNAGAATSGTFTCGPGDEVQVQVWAWNTDPGRSPRDQLSPVGGSGRQTAPAPTGTIQNKLTSIAESQTHDFTPTGVSGGSPTWGSSAGDIDRTTGEFEPPDVSTNTSVTVTLYVDGIAVDTDTFTVTPVVVQTPPGRVGTPSVSSITAYAATVSAAVPSTGTTPFELFVRYRTSAAGQTSAGRWSSWITMGSASSGSLSRRLPGLSPSTPYDVQVYATNVAGGTPATTFRGTVFTTAAQPVPARPASIAWTFSTIPNDPSGLRLGTITWSSVADADVYYWRWINRSARVPRWSAGTGSSATRTSGTSASVSGLNIGDVVEAQVWSGNDAGVSINQRGTGRTTVT